MWNTKYLVRGIAGVVLLRRVLAGVWLLPGFRLGKSPQGEQGPHFGVASENGTWAGIWKIRRGGSSFRPELIRSFRTSAGAAQSTTDSLIIMATSNSGRRRRWSGSMPGM